MEKEQIKQNKETAKIKNQKDKSAAESVLKKLLSVTEENEAHNIFTPESKSPFMMNDSVVENFARNELPKLNDIVIDNYVRFNQFEKKNEK